MFSLIDASLWVDFTRTRSPVALKRFVAPFILDPNAHLAESVMFELLRYATDPEAAALMEHFETMPMLKTPPSLWRLGSDLGRCCRKGGFAAASIDLLIATVAIEHAVELITFDDDFVRIAAFSKLKVRLLQRPS